VDGDAIRVVGKCDLEALCRKIERVTRIQVDIMFLNIRE